MPFTKTCPKQQAEINRPSCSACGTYMWLAVVSPDGPGKECRTFECPICEVAPLSGGERRTSAASDA